jgi:hypothetical protein
MSARNRFIDFISPVGWDTHWADMIEMEHRRLTRLRNNESYFRSAIPTAIGMGVLIPLWKFVSHTFSGPASEAIGDLDDMLNGIYLIFFLYAVILAARIGLSMFRDLNATGARSLLLLTGTSAYELLVTRFVALVSVGLRTMAYFLAPFALFSALVEKPAISFAGWVILIIAVHLACSSTAFLCGALSSSGRYALGLYGMGVSIVIGMSFFGTRWISAGTPSFAIFPHARVICMVAILATATVLILICAYGVVHRRISMLEQPMHSTPSKSVNSHHTLKSPIDQISAIKAFLGARLTRRQLAFLGLGAILVALVPFPVFVPLLFCATAWFIGHSFDDAYTSRNLDLLLLSSKTPRNFLGITYQMLLKNVSVFLPGLALYRFIEYRHAAGMPLFEYAALPDFAVMAGIALIDSTVTLCFFVAIGLGLSTHFGQFAAALGMYLFVYLIFVQLPFEQIYGAAFIAKLMAMTSDSNVQSTFAFSILRVVVYLLTTISLWQRFMGRIEKYPDSPLA